MKTVPLHGKKAAGRVARVDDGDYDLVMQYRWNVRETLWEPPRRSDGPYAFTTVKRATLYMHDLIMGTKGIDHRDHDGLNNQRSNLRPATEQQNRRNTRNRLGYSSQYKGVYWSKQRRRWHAVITIDSRSRNLGFYALETEAALAYDEAAREVFGEFACLNFPYGIPQAERDRLRAESAAADADREAEKRRALAVRVADWRASRPAETRVCTVCGTEYLTTTPARSFYCGGACAKKAQRQRARERAGAIGALGQPAGGAAGGWSSGVPSLTTRLVAAEDTTVIVSEPVSGGFTELSVTVTVAVPSTPATQRQDCVSADGTSEITLELSTVHAKVSETG